MADDSPMPFTLEMLADADGPKDDDEVLAACIREHTAARGVDLWAVEIMGYSAAEWADLTGRDRSTVSRNVRRAHEADE